jgi:hypothetical protein
MADERGINMKPIAAALAAAIIVAGCGQTSVDTTAIDIVVQKVQEIAVKICSFLPTDESVVNIIKASSTGETAYGIAKAICDAVTKADTEGAPDNAAGRSQCPMVKGVCIEGEFVPPTPKDTEPKP